MSQLANIKSSLNDFELRDGIYFPSDYEQLNNTQHQKKMGRNW